MKFISIQKAIEKKSGKVAVRGWVYRERGSNKMKFIVLRDSTNIIQCVLKRDDFKKQWKEIDALRNEASIEIEGKIKPDKRAPTGFEIQVSKINIIGLSEDFPLGKNQTIEFLADNRHLALRTRKLTAIMKIRDTVLKAMREHWRSKGFYEYHSPSLIGMQCEGGSTLFEMPYFKNKVFLTQTWQLHAEPAIFALEKIFTIQPAFRAEKSKTSRHLTELWMAEMEVAWESFDYIQDDAEQGLKHIIKSVLKENKQELEILKRDIKKLEPSVKKRFTRMTYTEALKILKQKKKINIPWGKDLRTIEEDKLSELYDTPIIITNYPKKVKAFYMKEDEKDPKTVLGFDIIAPEHYGEITGGSYREESIKKLKQNLKSQGEDPSKYEFYFDTRKYGSVPHGGYAFGVERVISWICGLENIKDAIAFPRTPTRFRP